MIRVRQLAAKAVMAIVVLGAVAAYGQGPWDIGRNSSDNVTASLSEGTLTISGTGDMADYTTITALPPWYNSRSSITTVIIGTGVTRLGARAFMDHTNLTYVSIANPNIAIGSSAFFGCTALRLINFGALTASLSTNLDLLTISGTGNMPNNFNFGSTFSSIRDSITAAVIGTDVTSIGNNAFSGCRNLALVTILGSVTSIGNTAFSGCRNLTSITIPNSVDSIGREAFNNSGLTSVTIPASVMSMGTNVFSNCADLTSIEVAANNIRYSSVNGVLFNKAQDTLIQYPRSRQGASYAVPNGVTAILAGAFTGSANLTSISIPSSAAMIGWNAFQNCSNLTSIEAAPDNAHFSSDGGVLFNKDKTALIQYPAGIQGAYTVPNGVTSIRDNAFNGSRGLASVIIPNSVTSIGYSAFAGCTGLTEVIIGGSVSQILNDAFFGCAGLTSITILNPQPPFLMNDIFTDVNVHDACLYVPENSVNSYRFAMGWGLPIELMPAKLSQQSAVQMSGLFPGFTCINPITSIANVNRVNSNSSIPAVSVRGRTLNVKLPASMQPPSSQNLQIRVIDMRGRTAANFNIVNGTDNSFPLTKVPAGRYIVEIKNAGARVNSMPVMVR